MANGVRGDIPLAEALELLDGLEPCPASMDKYYRMDQQQMAYEVWRSADTADLCWLVDELSIWDHVSCHKAKRRAYDQATKQYEAIIGPAFDAWGVACEATKQLPTWEKRNQAMLAANQARETIVNAALEVRGLAMDQADNDFYENLTSRASYRAVLRALKGSTRE